MNDIRIPKNFYRGEDFIKAINDFILNEWFILKNDLNERTVSHKLAEYFQSYFRDYNVDCEYNRMPREDKNWDEEYITKRLFLPIDIEYKKINDTKGKTVYPDVIIHKRGINSENFLAIEFKKKKNNRDKDFDFKKLKAFTTQLGYKWGVYLEFDEERISDIKWFKDGNQI